MSRGVADRTKLEEAPGSGFVECDRKTYRNKMPDQVPGLKKIYMNCRIKKKREHTNYCTIHSLGMTNN